MQTVIRLHLQMQSLRCKKYENPKWTEVEGTYTTGQNGTCIINLKKSCTRQSVWRKKRAKAPDGYALSDENILLRSIE